jgi:hypothetical protein
VRECSASGFIVDNSVLVAFPEVQREAWNLSTKPFNFWEISSFFRRMKKLLSACIQLKATQKKFDLSWRA